MRKHAPGFGHDSFPPRGRTGMMKIRRTCPMLLKKFRGQQFDDKNNLDAFKIKRQELMTIQTTGDHLLDSMIMKTFVNFLQGGKGRVCITEFENRIVAA